MRLVVAAVLALVACKGSGDKIAAGSGSERGTSTPPATSPALRGSIHRAPAKVELGLLARSGTDLAELERVVRDRAKTSGATVDVRRASPNDLGVTSDHLQWMFGSIPQSDYPEIAKSPGVVVVSAPGAADLSSLRVIAQLAADIAEQKNGWVIDPGVDGLFAPAGFRKRIPPAKLDVRKSIVVHLISGDEETPYLDTMGMPRFGLPEIMIPAGTTGESDAFTILVDITAQTLVERGDLSRDGALDIDVTTLDPSWAIDIDDIRKHKGTGRGTWNVRWRTSEHDGLPVLLLEPPTGRGVEGMMKMMDQVLGPGPEHMTESRADDPELVAATKHARADLDRMRAHFAKGVPAPEHFAVKVRFAHDAASELMWVDVVSWRGDTITGALANDPELVTSLHRGETVHVDLADVTDYIHELPDQTKKGGYSIEVFRKRGLVP